MATRNCSASGPSTDDRCADPAFREANPDLCKSFPLLILQPEQGLIQAGGTIEYSVFLRANGTETQLTKGLSWASSNVGAAVINEDGVATGVTAGQTTISVQWQNLSAQAQLDVVASCSETNQNFRILIDNSKSMGQSFSSSYATKLSFSKSISRDFCDTINFEKDVVAVSKFNDDYEELQEWIDESAAPKAAIAGISGSNGKTNLADALSEAVSGFDGQDGVRVIVLFTDGQWTGDDPKPVAQAFRESGGFLVIVATRAFNDSGSAPPENQWFTDLFTMASGGFLLSAYSETEDDILASLSGLKSFICSGGCSPEPGTAPTAALNYEGFINWDVTAGRVDLIGNGLWDVRPGNGLYVDLQGTGDEGNPPPGQDFGLGQLTSKEEYEFEDGKSYKFSIDVGGSLAGPTTSGSPVWTIRVRVGDSIDEEITINAGNTPLTTHEFPWTQSGDFTGPIIIEQTEQSGHHNIGSTIDNILLENITDDVVMLEDNFDEENPIVIPPGDGSSNFGCLETPPGTQSADSSPPPFLEE